MTIKAKAAIPNLQSAISIGGGKGNAVRLKLDVYISPDDIAKLYQMQEEEIDLTLTTREHLTENTYGEDNRKEEC